MNSATPTQHHEIAACPMCVIWHFCMCKANGEVFSSYPNNAGREEMYNKFYIDEVMHNYVVRFV